MAKCNKDQVEHLQKALKHEKDSTVRQRIQMILLREDVELLAITWLEAGELASNVRKIGEIAAELHHALCNMFGL